MVGLDGLAFDEVEPGVTAAVVRLLRGGRLGLGLGGFGGVVRGELGREVGGESRRLGLGRERVRLDSTDVGVLGLYKRLEYSSG